MSGILKRPRCPTGRRRHRTRAAARRAMVRPTAAPWMPLQSTHCPTCGGWHIEAIETPLRLIRHDPADSNRED